MNENLWLLILLTHFVGDFILQKDEDAKGKSKGRSLYNKHLFNHVLTYSTIWFLVTIFMNMSFIDCGLFTLITFITHYLTDWCTSRIGSKYWSKGDHHNGFVVVGADQVTHYITLYLTFMFI